MLSTAPWINILINQSIIDKIKSIPELEDKLKKAIDVLQEGFTNGANLEKLTQMDKMQKKPLFSFRLNRKARVIICKSENNEWIIHDILLNHEYRKINTENTGQITINLQRYNGNLILFTDQQQDVLSALEAVEAVEAEITDAELQQQQQDIKAYLVTGMPGSGKTLLASTFLQNLDDNTIDSNNNNTDIAYSSPDKNLFIAPNDYIKKQILKDLELIDSDKQLHAIEVKTIDEIKKEYCQSIGKTEADFTVFLNWYSEYQKSNKSNPIKKNEIHDNSQTLYREFEYIASFDDENSYLNITQRIGAKSDRNKLYSLYNKYCSYLDKKAMIDLSIQKSPQSKTLNKYSKVLIDEAQSYSFSLLKTLGSLCNETIIFLGDPNQDDIATHPRLSLLKDIYPQLKHHQLSNSYRCPVVGAAVANTVLAMRGDILGGDLEYKIRTTSITTDNKVIGEFSVAELKPNAKKSDYTAKNRVNLENAKNASQSTETIVATLDEYVEEAKKLFSGMVLPISAIKGVETGTIILYRVLERDGFADINKILLEQESKHEGKESTLKNNRPKYRENQVFAGPLNILFLLLTRARNEIFIIEENKHNVEKILFRLSEKASSILNKDVVSQNNETTVTVGKMKPEAQKNDDRINQATQPHAKVIKNKTTAEGWNKKASELEANGHLEAAAEAWRIYRNVVKEEAKSFQKEIKKLCVKGVPKNQRKDFFSDLLKKPHALDILIPEKNNENDNSFNDVLGDDEIRKSLLEVASSLIQTCEVNDHAFINIAALIFYIPPKKVPTTFLLELASNPNNDLLERMFKMDPRFSQKITLEAFCHKKNIQINPNINDRQIVESVILTPFHHLAYFHKIALLSGLLSANPELANVDPGILDYIPKTSRLSRILAILCESEEGQGLLKYLVVHNPGIRKLVADELFNNVAYYRFELNEMNPVKIYSNEGDLVNSNGKNSISITKNYILFSSLALFESGHELIHELFLASPDLIKKITEEMLFGSLKETISPKPITKCDFIIKSNNNNFSLLATSDIGKIVIQLIFKINPTLYRGVTLKSLEMEPSYDRKFHNRQLDKTYGSSFRLVINGSTNQDQNSDINMKLPRDLPALDKLLKESTGIAILENILIENAKIALEIDPDHIKLILKNNKILLVDLVAEMLRLQLNLKCNPFHREESGLCWVANSEKGEKILINCLKESPLTIFDDIESKLNSVIDAKDEALTNAVQAEILELKNLMKGFMECFSIFSLPRPDEPEGITSSVRPAFS